MNSLQSNQIKRSFLGLLLILATAFAGSGWGASDGLDPSFFQMKTFRSYFGLDGFTPITHRFIAYYYEQLVDGSLVPCALFPYGDTPDAVLKLELKDVELLWGGIVPQPFPVEYLPAELKSFHSAIESLAKRLSSTGTIQDFRVGYSGRFSVANLSEFIPTSQETEGKDRLFMLSQGKYRVEPATGTVKLFGMAILGSPNPCLTETCGTKKPNFIDFMMPAELEGSSLLWQMSDKPGTQYVKVLQSFSTVLTQTMKNLEEGTYLNPFDALLAKQGTGILPEKFAQWSEWSGMLVCRKKVGGVMEIQTPSFTFRMPTTDAYTQWAGVQKILGLETLFQISLQRQEAKLHIRGSGGKELDIKFDMEKPRVLSSGQNLGLSGLVSMNAHGTQENISLPIEGSGCDELELASSADIRPSPALPTASYRKNP